METTRYRTLIADNVAIAAGGALGSTVRYLAAVALPAAVAALPWATLAVNLAGSFALGFCMRAGTLGRRQLLFVAVGFLGSLTTYSTFAFEIATRLHAGHATLAATYAVVSLAAGLLAAYLGAEVARRRHGVVP